MNFLTKTFVLLSILLPVISWADYSSKDFAGEFITYNENPSTFSGIARENRNKTGQGSVNFSSVTTGGTTFSTNNGNASPITSTTLVLLDAEHGTGYYIVFFAGNTYTVYDFVAYSRRESFKVTDLVFNPNLQGDQIPGITQFTGGATFVNNPVITLSYSVRQGVCKKH